MKAAISAGIVRQVVSHLCGCVSQSTSKVLYSVWKLEIRMQFAFCKTLAAPFEIRGLDKARAALPCPSQWPGLPIVNEISDRLLHDTDAVTEVGQIALHATRHPEKLRMSRSPLTTCPPSRTGGTLCLRRLVIGDFQILPCNLVIHGRARREDEPWSAFILNDLDLLPTSRCLATDIQHQTPGPTRM